MPKKSVNIRKILNDYLEKDIVQESEFVKVATGALRKAGFERVIVFDHGEQLVMINLNASIQAIASGIVLNEEGTKISSFKNSLDRKSVSVNALTRHLIMTSINDENDLLRLRTLAKDQTNWIIHYVINKRNENGNIISETGFPPYICNAHTHGLEIYAHKDFQVILDIGTESIGYLLDALAERVRDGEMFSAGEKVKGVYEDCEVKLAACKEGNREVLRVLIPDANNNFPGDEDCAYPFSEQEIVLN